MDAAVYHELIEQLRQRLERSHRAIERMPLAELESLASETLEELMQAPPFAQVQAQIQPHQVLADCIGLGPLTELLVNPEISEIMVNHYQQIFVERHGVIEPTEIRFASPEQLHQVIERIVAPLGKHIDQAQPMVDARLHDGSRINAVLTPIAVAGTCLTIRKFQVRQLSLHDLEASGSISQEAKAYLAAAIAERKNILVVGGTGTGKTTLLNILASLIPASQRLITIEDSAELKIPHPNLVTLEARMANSDGIGAIGIRELLINALRMRPDRIIVGECRGAEALDMLQAMNTGHEGSLTTLHANSPREALHRLEIMVLMTGMELPLLAIRQQIAAAVDVIIQIKRTASGQRVVANIAELVGIDGSTLQLSELFHRNQHVLQPTGVASHWFQPESIQ
ncbi:CpaF family protein [Pseudidiomarina taiwanensis]|uniref:Pilus assembly protein CpaF n=1 Tax=Pseudidiomarina taiwanensis TaxID=337250 RepID=A0A432ZC62_9GAMM|nr:CpaF family protein [Pseudidiomarina taiwanensis]RUO75528.1 pilus assembly protein CpaF [Pseudidiomarina taiwanensis]